MILSSVLEEFTDSAAQTLLRLALPLGTVELGCQRRWVCFLLDRDLVLPDSLEQFST